MSMCSSKVTLAALAAGLLAVLVVGVLVSRRKPSAVVWRAADEIALRGEQVAPPHRGQAAVEPVRRPALGRPVAGGAAVAEPPRAAVTGRVSVHGRVVDRRGRPLAGVTVALQGHRGRSRAFRVRRAVETGAGGRFAFRGEGPLTAVTLLVSRAGCAPRVVDQRVATTDHDAGDIALGPGGVLEGRVVGAGGHGIAAAVVELVPERDHRLHWVRGTAAWLAPAGTDAVGRFRLEALMPGPYALVVVAPGHERMRRQNIAIEDGRTTRLPDFELAPARRLEGTVLAETGAPLGGATVELFAAATGAPPAARESIRTAGDGAFAFEHAPRAAVVVVARAPGHLSARMSLEAGPVDPLVLRLPAGLRLQGVVRDARTAAVVTHYSVSARRVGGLARRPLGGRPRRVAAVRENEAGVRRGVASRRAAVPAAHAGGQFELHGLDEGIYVVDVTAPDHLPYRSEPLELRRGAPVQVAVALSAGAWIRGTVIRAGDGEPVAGARVVAVEVADAGSPEPRASATADRGGTYRLGPLPPGRYAVAAEAAGLARATGEPFELAVDRTAPPLRLGALARLRGTVRGLPPAAGAEVVAFDGLRRSARAPVGPDGRYELSGLQPGRYVVRVSRGKAHELLAAQLARLYAVEDGGEGFDVELRAGQSARFDPPFEADPVGTLRGRVRGAAAGRVVILRSAGSGPGGAWRQRCDGSGGFCFERVPVGVYELRIGVGSEPQLRVEQVAVQRDRIAELELELPAGG